LDIRTEHKEISPLASPDSYWDREEPECKVGIRTKAKGKRGGEGRCRNRIRENQLNPRYLCSTLKIAVFKLLKKPVEILKIQILPAYNSHDVNNPFIYFEIDTISTAHTASITFFDMIDSFK